MSFPYTYFSCPCTDVTVPVSGSSSVYFNEDEDEEQERTFDPRSARADFSLFPLEHLLYCEDCQEIRCPRCTIEEIVCWFCPSCLFEVTSSMVKNDGNRCQRNCFNCPICTASMSVNILDPQATNLLAGPWILACSYCNWTSLDIGIQFYKPNTINEQLSKLKNDINRKPDPTALSEIENLSRSTLNRDPKAVGSHGKPSRTSKPTLDPEKLPRSSANTDPDTMFSSLKSFYTSQLSISTNNPMMTPSGEFNYNSPSSLARIMSLYTTTPFSKKSNAKSTNFRESADASEGLRIHSPSNDATVIQHLREQGWGGTTNATQQSMQIHPTRFTDDLRPTPTLLRTKRSKRCRTCRHILVKPEAKVSSTRYRIRLVAQNYIPKISLKPLLAPNTEKSSQINLKALPTLRPLQFLLILQNPLFDTVNITLATPSHTPGTHAHKVTILCPQFTIGSNTDAWDEALNEDKPHTKGSSKHISKPRPETSEGETRVAEAGKVWEKGKNWTSVVVEIVCQRIDGDRRLEDDDVLEIPVLVRQEYEVEVQEKDGGKERREVAFWVVLGVGRVRREGLAGD